MQLTTYHELRVKVELKSSGVREKLRAVDDVLRVTQDRLDVEVKQQKSLTAKAEKLQIAKLQSQKNLLEIDKKIRSVKKVTNADLLTSVRSFKLTTFYLFCLLRLFFFLLLTILSLNLTVIIRE